MSNYIRSFPINLVNKLHTPQKRKTLFLNSVKCKDEREQLNSTNQIWVTILDGDKRLPINKTDHWKELIILFWSINIYFKIANNSMNFYDDLLSYFFMAPVGWK